MEGITLRAAQRLKSSLEAGGLPPGEAVRLIPHGMRAFFQVDRPRPLDKVFQYEQRTVLMVDPRMSRMASGSVLDFRDGEFTFVAAHA